MYKISYSFNKKRKLVGMMKYLSPKNKLTKSLQASLQKLLFKSNVNQWYSYAHEYIWNEKKVLITQECCPEIRNLKPTNDLKCISIQNNIDN